MSLLANLPILLSLSDYSCILQLYSLFSFFEANCELVIGVHISIIAGGWHCTCLPEVASYARFSSLTCICLGYLTENLLQ